MRSIVTSEEMYACERNALSKGLVSVDDMMNIVGKKVAESALSLFPSFSSKPHIVLLLGKGNNGADGSTAGAYLLEKGHSVFFCQIEEPALNSPPSVFHERKRKLISLGAQEIALDNLSSMFPEEQPLIIIDAIYGIGFKDTPSLRARKAIEWANQSIYPKIAIDIPSGLNPNTGEVIVNAIRADITIACHLPKKGFFFNLGWEHVGEIVIADIGLPPPSENSEYVLIEESDLAQMLPTYKRDQDKFSRGQCVTIGGSKGLLGALELTLRSALTTGIGYLIAILRPELESSIQTLPTEAVKQLLPQDQGEYPAFLEEIHSKADAVIIGPGMGRDSTALQLFKEIWNKTSLPRVIDADALFFLSKEEILPNSLNNAILTPHLGEAKRLVNYDLAKRKDTEALIKRLKEKYLHLSPHGIILLKGAPSFIIRGSEETIYVIAGGDPALATLGSGDVLAGAIGSFLSQTKDLFTATILGAGIHALAGQMAAKTFTSYCVNASRVIDSIPLAFDTLLKRATNGTFRKYMPASRTKLSSIKDDL